MNAEATIAMLKLRVSRDQRRACRYLERQGQHFCVEFGYGNAIEKAREHWNALRRKRRKQQRRGLRVDRSL